MKNKLKLSQWHSSNVKPAYDGLYQVKNIELGNLQEWAFWHGGQWKQQWCLKKNAIKYFPCIYMEKIQNKSWRGIVK